tara:strand:- start:59479 stop:60618 length:1140 start_codon:yes stop_codon:yes gene_type:complete
MTLALNEQQQLLKRSAEQFFREQAPVKAQRALRDSRDADGFSRALWSQMADMGFAGTCLGEGYGGIGCGFVELGVVLEAAGRTLAASPLLASLALGAQAVLLGGSETLKSSLLPRVAAGETLLTLAYQESAHHRPTQVAAEAREHGDGYVLNAHKCYVLDGHIADYYIVSARTAPATEPSAGISLFLVARGAPGVSVRRLSMVDSRNMADLVLENVALGPDALLGELHAGYPLLEQVLARANIALCAEMLGSMQEAFERTLAYLQLREQFDVPIGSFQALQHRAAQMFCEIEMSRSLVLRALSAVDEQAVDIELLASAAKVQVSESLRLVSDEAIQMHGGIGMTDEEEIGFFLKRARVAQQTFGDEFYNVQRYASLRGY